MKMIKAWLRKRKLKKLDELRNRGFVKKGWIIRNVFQGEVIPRFYGYIRPCPLMFASQHAPIPLNFLIKWWIKLWHYLKFPNKKEMKKLSKWFHECQPLADFYYNKGLSEGYGLGFKHGKRPYNVPMTFEELKKEILREKVRKVKI